MVTRVYVNVDQEPFCAELVFPKGLDVGGFVSLVFGPFGQERVDGDHSQRHLSLRTGSKAGESRAAGRFKPASNPTPEVSQH